MIGAPRYFAPPYWAPRYWAKGAPEVVSSNPDSIRMSGVTARGHSTSAATSRGPSISAASSGPSFGNVESV